MKATFIACSELSSIDGATNKASLFNLLDYLTVATVPFIISDVSILLVLEKGADEPDKQEGQVDAMLNGKQLFSIPVRSDFNQSALARNLTTLENVLVPEIGNLELNFVHNGETQVSWLIRIVHTGPPVMEKDGQKEGRKKGPIKKDTKKAVDVVTQQ